MFTCTNSFLITFSLFGVELYLTLFYSIIFYYLSKLNIVINKSFLYLLFIFILILLFNSTLFNTGVEGYTTAFFFNHLQLTNVYILWNHILFIITIGYGFYLFFYTQTNYFFYNIIILINLIFFLKLLFLTNSIITLIFTFEIVTLLILLQLVYYTQVTTFSEQTNFIALFFYNFWITFFTSILLFILTVVVWQNFYTFNMRFIEYIGHISIYYSAKKMIKSIFSIMLFMLIFFIKIGFIPFFFWKFTIFNYFSFNYFIFYFFYFLFNLFIFFFFDCSI